MGYEFELKYCATAQILAAVRRQIHADWHTITMETTYYDDPANRLSQRHYTLRRRLENGISVCTLKTPMPDGGRGEWEVCRDTIQEAIPELCKLGAPKDLLLLTADGIFPSCGARFTRQAATVQWGDAMLEIALDEGILFGGGKELPLCELEVELKDGDKALAVAYAQSLAQEFGLILQHKSKVSRARALAIGG